jgi:hypothetical protein
MDSLAALIVEAVEAVDGQRQGPAKGRALGALPQVREALDEVYRAYDAGAATWAGCDWPTAFGRSRLNLEGVSAAAAGELAVEADGTEVANDWGAAAEWLKHVEALARQAEDQADAAVAAATAGAWRDALEHAERAWGLEFSTGRPIWHGYPVAWQRLRLAVEAAYATHRQASG